MKIADIELGDRPLFLAPMEDVTDPSFRYMCKRFGADVVYTEFISSDGLIRDAGKSLAKLRIAESEGPWVSSFTVIWWNRWSRRLGSPRRPIPISSISTSVVR